MSLNKGILCYKLETS